MDGYESDSRQQLTFVKETSHRPDFKAALRPRFDSDVSVSLVV